MSWWAVEILTERQISYATFQKIPSGSEVLQAILWEILAERKVSEGRTREALQETRLRGEYHGILSHLVKPFLPKTPKR